MFENYVGQLLVRFNTDSLKFTHHKKAFSDLIVRDQETIYQVCPDFSLFVNEECKAILDAKYKCPLEGNQYKIVREDIYQLTTYAMHFGCKNIYLLYPAFKGAYLQEPLIGSFEIKLKDSSVFLTAIQLNMEDLQSNKIVLRDLIIKDFVDDNTNKRG